MKKRHVIIATITILATLFLVTSSAFAHVGISPNTAEQGGYGAFSFKVPNETDSANTIKLEVKFPTDHPIASVSVEPKQGWTYTVTKEKLTTPIKTDDGEVTEAVSTITWSGGVIRPGEFDEFRISMGPLPDVNSLSFPALQTYDNGEVVSWIEKSVEGADEPEHPAPTLMLTKASGESPTSNNSQEKTMDSKKSESSNTAGYVGIGVGVLALIVGGFALVRKK